MTTHIDYDQPFQPVTMADSAFGMLLTAVHEERADSARGQAGSINGRDAASAFVSGKTFDHLGQSFGQIFFFQSAQESIERRMIRHTGQLQGLTQFPMLAQTNFGFAVSPIFKTDRKS